MESQTIQTERLRVLYSELNRGLMLLCPDTGSPVAPNTNIDQKLIYWVNETSISNIPDNQISIASLILLTPVLDDRFNLVSTRPYSELSCGYYFNNRYTRIKKWSLTYVDKADVQLKRTIDESYFKLISFNSSVFQINYQISNSTLLGLSKSRNIFKLDCEPNFDRPLIITTFIWLHYIKMENFKVTVDETLQMVANPGTVYPDDMQIFEGTDRKVEFITLLKNLYNSPDNSVYINLQCASYTEGFNIGAKSADFNIIKRDSGSAGAITNKHGGLTTLEIVLICVFSILGLLLLLALLILLYCCCCGALRKRKEDKSEIKNKNTVYDDKLDKGVEVPIRTLKEDEDEFLFSSNTKQKNSYNNTDSTNRLTYRTSLHLDNINNDHIQRDQPFSYINEPKHVTTLPNLQRNELTVIKDPSNYEDSSRDEYNTQFYRDNHQKFLSKKEKFYEVKTITTKTTKNLPSISGTVPLEITYPNYLVHDV